jgi:preprotein translocase subunit YajC
MGIVLILVLFALFWAFLIRPKQRELKRHQSLVATLDVGDEVMTGSGFYGVLTEVGEDTVRIELAPGLEVKVARRAVAAKVPDPSLAASAALAGADDDDDDGEEAEVADDDIVDAELVESEDVEQEGAEVDAVEAEIADEHLDADASNDRETPR